MCAHHLVDGSAHQIAEIVQAVAVRHGIAAAFAHDDSFVDGGLTSMGMVELMLAIEGGFNLRIPDHELNAAAFSSIATLTALVDRLTMGSKQVASRHLQSNEVQLFQRFGA